jgi:hypothetical protein
MIGKLIPKYTIENKCGEAPKLGRTFRLWKIYWITEHLSHQILPIHSEPTMKQINPFRDLQYGGTTLGKWWFADKTLFGLILKFIFI